MKDFNKNEGKYKFPKLSYSRVLEKYTKLRKLLFLVPLAFLFILTSCENQNKAEQSQETSSSNTTGENQIASIEENPSSSSSPFSFDHIELEGSDLFTGDHIDNSIFQNVDVTMVNVWGTFCQPCIVEMPDIAKLHEEGNTEFQVLGIVIDTVNTSMENHQMAQDILKNSQAKFPNLTPSISFSQKYFQDFQIIPTTFFVDKEGKVIGQVNLGAASYEEYKALIREALESLK